MFAYLEDGRSGVTLPAYCPCASVKPGLPSKLRSVYGHAEVRDRGRMMRAISCPICGLVARRRRNRQRKLSVQNVSGNPSGHTFTPRLAIISSFRPSPEALPTSRRDRSGCVQAIDVDVDADQFLLAARVHG